MRQTAAVAHAENGHALAFYREENPVHIRPVSEEKMPDFEGNRFVFRSEWTAAWKVSER